MNIFFPSRRSFCSCSVSFTPLISLVKQGLLELEPAPGRYSGKLLHLTPAGRELAAKTAKPVYSAEQAALEQLGMAEAEHFVRLGQEHLNAIRTEFNKILQQEKV